MTEYLFSPNGITAVIQCIHGLIQLGPFLSQKEAEAKTKAVLDELEADLVEQLIAEHT
jgi:hypothetical protein